MGETKPSVEWSAWFTSADAAPTKKRLATAAIIKPEVTGISQSTATELVSIKKPLRRRPTTTELHDYLDALNLEDLQRHVASHTACLHAAGLKWDQTRRAGWRKARTGAQEFAVTFESFLKSFSGIIEIAKMADEAYGGAATQVLSLFYATIKMKATNDEAIITAMQTITHRLPDAQIYSQVYADEVLAMMIADAYKQVILFAKSAISYFNGRGLSRAMRSIGNPTEFVEIAESLVQIFTNIRIRCEALLSQRVAYLAVQNATLMRQLKVLTDGQNTDRVRRMQKLLNRRQSDSKHILDDQLLKHRRFLSLVANESPSDLSRMGLQNLKTLPEYRVWEAGRSGLFFLHGCNHESEIIPQSWLSLAVADLIADLQQNSSTRRAVAFELCSPQQTIDGLVGSLISQLLDMQPSVLGNAEDEREIELRLSRSQDSGHSAASDAYGPLRDYSWVLKEVIDKCDSDVYLVISQPEACGKGDLWALIKGLLGVIANVENVVRILMVVRTELWSIEERLPDIDKSLRESGKFIVSRHDQTEMEDPGF